MSANQPTSAEVSMNSQSVIELSGAWTAVQISSVILKIESTQFKSSGSIPFTIDASRISKLDSAGAWVLLGLLKKVDNSGKPIALTALPEKFKKLLAAAEENIGKNIAPMEQASLWSRSEVQSRVRSATAKLGSSVTKSFADGLDLLSFCGETAIAFGTGLLHPSRLRARPVFFNIRTAGFDALPIVGLLSLLLGVVVAYQSADQLRNFGASIFVADIVGLSMVREFSPLIVAIIIAGRSGSAYAAQIGTMAVTEELDSLRTIGISPIELLVIPKVLALALVMPLLTVYSDVLGVFGGMLMASQQLGIGFSEFSERLVKAVSVTAFLTGLGKVPVFAIVIAMISCFQGFKTKGGADSVGRQTTKSVVQSIFWVIVVDAIFSVVFNALDL